MKKLLIAAALSACVGMVAEAAKTTYYTLGDSVTLAPAAGIHSDGGGTYSTGVSGVQVLVYTNGSGDLTVNLGTGRGARTFIAETTATNLLAQMASPLPAGTTPCFFLNVTDIWDLGRTPIGTPVLKTATFNFSGGAIEFGDYKGNGLGQYSQQVWVRRNSRGSWTVTTDGTTVGAVSTDAPDGIVNRTEAVYAVSEKSGLSVKAVYGLPFTLDAVCTRCELNPVPTP